MALASLCNERIRANDHGPSFTAFIVDHQLRQSSRQEAKQVAEELKRLRIHPRILTLDWTEEGDPSSLSNLESVARRLRYQALGVACRKHGITSLLIAHHADDQAETVMLRLLGGYLGFGLRGVKRDRPIPYCDGFYGINRSGSPQGFDRHTRISSDCRRNGLRVEAGGVTISRPLLPFTKDQLVAHCKASGVKWFEDATNMDRTFTLRNTVRHLLQTDVLPRALRSPRLLALAATVGSQEKAAEWSAQRVFEQTTIRLDIRTGIAHVHIPVEHGLVAATTPAAHTAKSILLRKLLALVTPTDDVTLQNLHDPVAFMFPESIGKALSDLTDSAPKVCQIAGAMITCGEQSADNRYFVLQRRLPPVSETTGRHELRPALDRDSGSRLFCASDWYLWDNRYWVHVHCPTDHSSKLENIRVQFLTAQALAALRKSLNQSHAKRLDRLLKAAPGSVRFTLPAVVMQTTSASTPSMLTPEQIVAIPTIGWSAEGWDRWPAKTPPGRLAPVKWYWEVRYKQVDLAVTERHSIVG